MESQWLAFQCQFIHARPSDPTISGGFKQVFAASSKGFPSHPADARHLQKAREKRLFATPSTVSNGFFGVNKIVKCCNQMIS
ncbi:MAG: hypothetical protein AB1547_11255 [Thermodesulfobacteriota bacterium]